MSKLVLELDDNILSSSRINVSCISLSIIYLYIDIYVAAAAISPSERILNQYLFCSKHYLGNAIFLDQEHKDLDVLVINDLYQYQRTKLVLNPILKEVV